MRRTMIGMTQGELAAKVTAAGIKIDNSAIARIEKEQRRIDLDEAVVISRALGVDLNYMLNTDYPDDIREWVMRLNAERQKKAGGDGGKA
jgi:transcriptional regulator with XRE-family HTH domain